MALGPGSRQWGRRVVDLCLVMGVVLTLWNLSNGWSRTESKGRAQPARLPTPLMTTGERVPIAKLWTGEAKRTALLMLDVRCHACQESREFYRSVGRLVATTPMTRFVILTEDPVEVARKWLDEGGVLADNVLRIRARERFGFVGTPTMVLTDAKGVITDIAVGKLSQVEEDRFTSRLRAEAGAEPLRLPYSIREISMSDQAEGDNWIGDQLIDTRDRQAFGLMHSDRAANIPQDELMVRGPAELQRSLPVYVDCRHDDQRNCRLSGDVLGEAGFRTVISVLR